MRDETSAQRRRTVIWLLGVAALACVAFNALAQTDVYLRVVGYSDLAMFPERSGKGIPFAFFIHHPLPLFKSAFTTIEPCLNLRCTATIPCAVYISSRSHV